MQAPKVKKEKRIRAKKPKPVTQETRGSYLPDAFDAFVHWMILTPDERAAEGLPPTRVEFAKKHDTTGKTLSEWVQRADFKQKRRDAVVDKWSESTPQVIEGLFKAASKKGFSLDVELWLAYIESWDRKQVLEIKPTLDLNDNDIRKVVSKLPEAERKQFYDTITALILKARNPAAAANGRA